MKTTQQISNQNSIVKLPKLINTNKTIQCLINVDIRDYDIEKAHITALRLKMGDKIYNELINMDKLSALTRIGKMQRGNKALSDYFNETLKGWIDSFCEMNNIKWKSFIQTTKDSIMVYDKVVHKLTLEGGKVRFRDKDGAFTSMYQIGNRMYLFDSRRGKIIVKGMTDDEDSYFLQKFLAPLLQEFESIEPGNKAKFNKVMTRIRKKYINSKDMEIYRNVFHKNRFKYIVDGNIVFFDSYQPGEDDKLDKTENLVKVIRPIAELASIYLKRSKRSSLI